MVGKDDGLFNVSRLAGGDTERRLTTCLWHFAFNNKTHTNDPPEAEKTLVCPLLTIPAGWRAAARRQW